MATLLDISVVKVEDQRRRAYLDAHVVTNLHVFHKASAGDNNTSAFVAADQWELRRQRPVAVDSVQICVTYAGESE